MKILITGNEGFIGSNLEIFLKELGHIVIGLDIKSGNDILICDLPDCDAVIHLAGIGGVRESISDPARYWKVNVDGTKRILDRYQENRVLVAGSSSQYEPYLNPYAASKHVIEKIPHPNVVFMRLHTVYGPTPRKGMFFDKLLNGTLEYVTDHYRDFIHVEDVCSAINLLLNSTITGSIDIGTGNSIKISDIRSDLPVNANTTGERLLTRADTTIMSSLGFIPNHNVLNFLRNIRR